ncbi:hypothetical protein LTR53_017736, partial [Teratosphaeriaceae sp. CCFEE 6253]
SLAGGPPKQPVAILLAHAAAQIEHATEGKVRWSRSWFMRLVDTREKYLSNAPYTSLESLESYAENTYSTLLYLTLQALPMASISADHVASHIGKASGIATVLRGLPLLAFPGPAPTHHTPSPGSMSGERKQGAVTLPLDLMAQHNVQEEDVLRNGGSTQGLRDAVFTVATRANDHLITARSLLTQLRGGGDADHAFEHADEAEHVYLPSSKTAGGGGKAETSAQEVARAFPVFMPAIATQLWLERLEKADFDVFSPKLRVTDWRLPWRAFWAWQRRKI